MDRWLPAIKCNDNRVVQPDHTGDIRTISKDKLQMANLKTMMIIKSKAGDLLFVRRNMAGKRFRDDPGEWWLWERALSSSRREPWPGRRRTSGASPSCEEEVELQKKHHLLWRKLDLTEPYLVSSSSEDSKTSPEVKSIVVESSSGRMDNIIMVEGGEQARVQRQPNIHPYLGRGCIRNICRRLE